MQTMLLFAWLASTGKKSEIFGTALHHTEKNLSLNSCQKLVSLTSFALSRWRWQNRQVLPRQWQVISQKLVTLLSKSCQEMHDKEDLSNELTSQKFVIFLSIPRHRMPMLLLHSDQIYNVSQIKMFNQRHEVLLSCL